MSSHVIISSREVIALTSHVIVFTREVIVSSGDVIASETMPSDIKAMSALVKTFIYLLAAFRQSLKAMTSLNRAFA